ncbi:MAG: non-ribosomal peptide synthetase [Terriglobales bacterium]
MRPFDSTLGSPVGRHCGVPECLAQDLFVEQARRTPGRAAVISSKRTLTYADLLSASRTLGYRLRGLGVKPNTLVAVVMDKGWEQIAGVLGILEAGAAYLPIDPSVPSERLRYLLENGEVEVVVSQSWVEERMTWPRNVVRLCVDLEDLSETHLEPLPRVQTADDVAYVLYTSGSTGNPKGVMIGHRGLVNCIVETNRTFGVTSDDRALAVTALHHDMSVYDIFGLLAAGGTIVMPDREGTRSPDHWVELIGREQVTVWNSVPAFMEMLLVHAAAQNLRVPNRLRLAFLGGDWIPLTAPARIREHFGDVRVVSVGGPTETTVWNIWYAVDEVRPGWGSIPYGHAIANTRYYVLDENLEDCPAGVAGELCCSGVGLLKGYWRNEEQTKARTAIHPRTGERIYKTGDRGRLMPDGEIEFLGRIDRQIKISGQRIELGEIEAALIRQPGVKQAIVDAVDLEGHKKLAAYVVPEKGVLLEGQKLRTALEVLLPAYMVPFSFLMMETLPLNSNGKVDRSLLPASTVAAAGPSNGHSAAKSGMEETVSAVWRKLLGLEHIGPEDNFFDMGGDSILLVQAHGELQNALNRTFPVTDLFQFPSVRTLARALEGQARQQQGGREMADRIRKQREALARQRTAGRFHE